VKVRTILGASLLLLVSVQVNAALFDRGSGLIYDDVLDITWTQNANINGFDTWDNQIAWVADLSLYDSVRNVTWDDWRLPYMGGPQRRCKPLPHSRCHLAIRYSPGRYGWVW
jgi:hypothetical protein